MRGNFALILIASVLLAPPLAAQTPEGSEIRASNQSVFTWGSGVAAAANGDFIVVWEGSSPPGHDRIWARRFSASGKPRSREFLVDPSFPKHQENPVVAAAPGGSFIVAWVTKDALSQAAGLFVRCFSAGGGALGPAVRVSLGITSTCQW